MMSARDMLDGLRAAGYLTTDGEEDAGPFFHLLRGGGYYLGLCSTFSSFLPSFDKYSSQIGEHASR